MPCRRALPARPCPKAGDDFETEDIDSKKDINMGERNAAEGMPASSRRHLALLERSDSGSHQFVVVAVGTPLGVSRCGRELVVLDASRPWRFALRGRVFLAIAHIPLDVGAVAIRMPCVV